MPTYQYACSDCGHDFEAFQSFSDDALTECPVCGAPVRKVYGSVGVVFKGSGFYRTDSRSSSSSAEPAKSGASSSSSSDSSSSTSSSTPAASASSSSSSSSSD